jgi:hypothetical protein
MSRRRSRSIVPPASEPRFRSSTDSHDKLLEGGAMVPHNHRAAAGLAAAKARRDAAAARDAVLEPVLRETLYLSAQEAAEEVERRGLRKISHKTVVRARARLGLEG